MKKIIIPVTMILSVFGTQAKALNSLKASQESLKVLDYVHEEEATENVVSKVGQVMEIEGIDPEVLRMTNEIVAKKKFEKEYNNPGHEFYSDFRTDVLWDKQSLNDQQVDLSDEEYAWEFAWPVEVKEDPHVGELTSHYGPRWGRNHYGVDLAVGVGDDLYSMFSGKVRWAGRAGTYGNVVIIRHHNGLETLYAHMNKVDVKAGDMVKAGDLVGEGGNTGRSTGPHLHLEMRYKGQPIDPELMVAFAQKRLKREAFDIAVTKGKLDAIAAGADQGEMLAQK